MTLGVPRYDLLLGIAAPSRSSTGSIEARVHVPV
jgi:hypothetical protein